MSILADKTFGQYIVVLILSLIILLIYYYATSGCYGKMDGSLGNITWNRNHCEYTMNQTLEDELSKYNIQRSDKNWNLYFPCGYDEIDKEIEQMPIVNGAKYFIIDNCDEMVAKEWLWKNVVAHYGLDIAKTMIPNGYVLYDEKELPRFNKEYDTNKIYIMKKNIQRQEGLKITKSKDDILNGHKEGYVLAQELLQNPYVISGRKTNMRFYVLVTCKNGKTTAYAHKDGFMYYTKDMFVTGSTDEGPNITTGYIDRNVYDENPLTHEDLREYLDDDNRKDLLEIETRLRSQNIKVGQVYFDRIYQLLKAIFITFVGKICKNKKFSKTTMFQLFGVDVAVDNNLNPMVMEINKGPDMGAKDKRDSELKHGVMSDVLTVIETVNKKNSREPRFIKLFEVENGKYI